jgi:hypothetical protein
MIEPTAEDAERDLPADLAYLAEVEAIEPGEWHVSWNVDVSKRAFGGWPAAIRRALAAEEALADCRKVCASLAAQSELLSRRAEGEHG